MKLRGTESYEYGDKTYPVTDKQERIISRIEHELGIKFIGNTSREAYVFISKHHKKIKDMKKI